MTIKKLSQAFRWTPVFFHSEDAKAHWPLDKNGYSYTIMTMIQLVQSYKDTIYGK